MGQQGYLGEEKADKKMEIVMKKMCQAKCQTENFMKCSNLESKNSLHHRYMKQPMTFYHFTMGKRQQE